MSRATVHQVNDYPDEAKFSRITQGTHPQGDEYYEREHNPEDRRQDLDDLLLFLQPGYNLRRGDVVKVGPHDYRNDGKLFYDGEKLVDLEYELASDYGVVIPDFLVPLEFPPRYWYNDIETSPIDGDDIPYRFTGWSRIPTRDDVYLTNNHLVVPVQARSEIYYFFDPIVFDGDLQRVDTFLELLTNTDINYFQRFNESSWNFESRPPVSIDPNHLIIAYQFYST